MIHLSQPHRKATHITYWRNPTKAEIKFGHGAIHFRDFDFKLCFNEAGYLKYRAKATDDNLIYHVYGMEYFATSQAKLEKLEVG